MKEIAITLTRSKIASLPNQKRTLKALGLNRTNQTVVKGDTPTIRGMIRIVEHLVTVTER
jgi:large subunit ribosomal protein L30